MKAANISTVGWNAILPLLHRFNWIGPVTTVLATAATMFACVQIGEVARLVTQEAQSEHAEASITKKYLVGKDYVDFANAMIQLNPAVQFGISKDGQFATVSVTSPEHFPEFYYALNTLDSFGKGIVWEAEKLCAGKCEGGAGIAHIKGYRQIINVK